MINCASVKEDVKKAIKDTGYEIQNEEEALGEPSFKMKVSSVD